MQLPAHILEFTVKALFNDGDHVTFHHVNLIRTLDSLLHPYRYNFVITYTVHNNTLLII